MWRTWLTDLLYVFVNRQVSLRSKADRRPGSQITEQNPPSGYRLARLKRRLLEPDERNTQKESSRLLIPTSAVLQPLSIADPSANGLTVATLTPRFSSSELRRVSLGSYLARLRSFVCTFSLQSSARVRTLDRPDFLRDTSTAVGRLLDDRLV